MSSVRVQKIFQGLAESLRKLGPYSNALQSIRWQGRDVNGQDAVLIDITSATWASNNLRVIIVADPAHDANNTAAFKTQSHASGYYLDGSVSFNVYMETPHAWTDSFAKFQREILHVLRGQLGAPIQLYLTAHATEPTKNGVNGAVADASFTDAGTYQPYFFSVPGGI